MNFSTAESIATLIAFARETWPDDGAEGETVHRLCRELEIERAERVRMGAKIATIKLCLDDWRKP